ncbi:MAG: glutathione S-transferase [Pseudomonadota bacterium]
MKLYWCAQTRASRMVWMLEEAGVAYDLVTIDIRNPDAPRPPEFLAASPMGKVPALSDGNVHMAESAAMCLYIADRYAPGRLAPAIDSDERADFLQWLFFTPAVIEPAMSEKATGAEPRRATSGWGSFDAMIDAWTARMTSREWVLDSGFSAADVMLGGSAAFLKMFGMLPDSATVLSDYADRSLARPGYARALAMESA